MSVFGPRGRAGPFHTTTAYSPAGQDKEIIRKRLEADMEAFGKSGGAVELLGVTPLRRKAKKEVMPAVKAKAAEKGPGSAAR